MQVCIYGSACPDGTVGASIPALRQTLLARALCAGAPAGKLRKCGYGDWLVEPVVYFLTSQFFIYEQYHQPDAGVHTEVFQNTS